MSIKRTLLSPFMRLLFRNRHVSVDKNSLMDRHSISNNSFRGNKQYPIIVRKSTVGNIDVGKGTKIFESTCMGKCSLGRFVTLAGPGIKIVGGINGIEIKDFCSIAANTIIQENNHNYKLPTTYFICRNLIHDDNCNEESSKGKITIDEGVWIGANSVILSGVHIGRGAIIGAGSIVNCDIEPYAIYAGNPAKKIKYRFSEDSIKVIEKTKWWLKTESDIIEMKEFFKEELE